MSKAEIIGAIIVCLVILGLGVWGLIAFLKRRKREKAEMDRMVYVSLKEADYNEACWNEKVEAVQKAFALELKGIRVEIHTDLKRPYDASGYMIFYEESFSRYLRGYTNPGAKLIKIAPDLAALAYELGHWINFSAYGMQYLAWQESHPETMPPKAKETLLACAEIDSRINPKYNVPKPQTAQ